MKQSTVNILLRGLHRAITEACANELDVTTQAVHDDSMLDAEIEDLVYAIASEKAMGFLRGLKPQD